MTKKYLQVKIKKLSDNAVIPFYAKEGDAGMDLVATSVEYMAYYIEYGTGLAMEIPEGYVGLIYPRSSLSKYQLVLANGVGIIDAGYRNEIKLRFKLWDNGETVYTIGDKIGQIMIIPYPKIVYIEVDDLSKTERGMGGFGHTG